MGRFAKYENDNALLIQDFINMKNESIGYLYDTLYPKIRKYVIQNGGLEEDSADIFQDTLLTAYQNFKDGYVISRDLNLTTYFFGIARNLYSSHLRYKARLEKNFESQFEISDSDQGLSGFDEELQEILTRSFNLLPEKEKMILTLFSEGMTYKEIAQKLGYKSENHARKAKYKAKETLLSFVNADPDYKSLSKID